MAKAPRLGAAPDSTLPTFPLEDETVWREIGRFWPGELEEGERFWIGRMADGYVYEAHQAYGAQSASQIIAELSELDATLEAAEARLGKPFDPMHIPPTLRWLTGELTARDPSNLPIETIWDLICKLGEVRTGLTAGLARANEVAERGGDHSSAKCRDRLVAYLARIWEPRHGEPYQRKGKGKELELPLSPFSQFVRAVWAQMPAYNEIAHTPDAMAKMVSAGLALYKRDFKPRLSEPPSVPQ
jgi:hypothetical protein